MDAKTNIKNRLPSRHVTEGPSRAPHRSYLYAMGLTTQQIHQPFVGVASCWNEAAPCNISLMRQAQAVKKGVAAAGKYEGYQPLVVEICKFFKTGQAPVSAEETIEIFAFMEAADESKRQGGVPVTLESVLRKAQEENRKKYGDN